MSYKKIVVMGGGTGTYTVLLGLKKYNLNLKAIVAMTDDGGSSGILRDELGVLPPGDLRQCLIALSESPDILREIFNFRFSQGELKGHNLGNLLISALEKMKGGLDKALPYLNSILALKGEVIPVTFSKARLVAQLKNGHVLFGEHSINTNKLIKSHPIKKLFIQPKPKANPRAVEVIKKANAIVIGPGNLYCSLIPLFLVEGIQQAVSETKAKIIYNVNLMNKFGHTDNFCVMDFVKEIERYIGAKKIDYVIFNRKTPAPEIVKIYSNQGDPVQPGKLDAEKRDGRVFFSRNLIKDEIYQQKRQDILKRTLIRHDSDKLAKAILEALNY